MQPFEIKVIKEFEFILKTDSQVAWDNIFLLTLLVNLDGRSYGTLSAEFIDHPSLHEFLEKYKKSIWREQLKIYVLQLRIEHYLNTKNNPELSKQKLTLVTQALKDCLSDMTPENKAQGVAMLPTSLQDYKFIKDIYLLNDERLSTIFASQLPIPRANLFIRSNLPKIVAERNQASSGTITKILGQAGIKREDREKFERSIVNAQRRFRAKQRAKEDLERVSARLEIPKSDTKKILKDANSPYIPQCHEELAKRIVVLSKDIRIFSKVKHLTTCSAVESIFNDALYGRRTLQQLYIPFKPAALKHFDIQEGDANVICLGANLIDDQVCPYECTLEFDVTQLTKKNPCIFFKQRDLAYSFKKIREITIGNLTINFSHTVNRPSISKEDSVNCYFYVFDNSKQPATPIAKAKIKNSLLIAYDLKKMHQILTLNFFRFIDALDDKTLRDKIYAALNGLSDEMLVQVLKKISKQMTDTMEFNFYGAYKIDFAALIAIKIYGKVLDLPEFVKELELGNIPRLEQVMKDMPQIFTSYRFIDYLLSNTNSNAVITMLNEQREKCVVPEWLDNKNKGPS